MGSCHSSSKASEERPIPEEGGGYYRATGLRKAGQVANLPRQEDDCQRSDEPDAADHLYFGVGGGSSSSSRSQPVQQSQPLNDADERGECTRHDNGVAATDTSGFPQEAALNQSQCGMGYQYLTYGGSLQYDHAGTHGAGTVNAADALGGGL